MLIKYKDSILFKAIALTIVGLFLVNDVAWAQPANDNFPKTTTLAAASQVNQPEFMEKFKAKEFLLAHEGENNYIKAQIEKEKEILGKDWESRKTKRLDITNPIVPSVMLVSITGLLAHTGQFAHVGLSGRDYNGISAIYIDSQFFNDPEKTIQKHEIDEVLQWENLRVNVLKITDKTGMRKWIKENIDSARKYARKFHKNSYPLDSLYKKYADKTDFNYEYINLMLALYGFDEDSSDVNIAAQNDSMVLEKPPFVSKQKISDTFILEKRVANSCINFLIKKGVYFAGGFEDVKQEIFTAFVQAKHDAGRELSEHELKNIAFKAIQHYIKEEKEQKSVSYNDALGGRRIREVRDTKIPDKDTFGGRLKSFMDGLQLTREKLANLMGMCKTTIRDWESEKKSPYPNPMKKLANILRTTVSWLLTGMDEEKLMSMRIEDEDDPAYQKLFGFKIKVLRYKKGLTLEELARRLKISRAAIGYWESGKSFPSPKHMKKLSEILNTTVSRLLTGMDEEELMNIGIEDEDRFGSKIKVLRYKIGLKKGEFTALIGVSKERIGLWESGEHLPRPKHIKILAEKLGTTPERLMGEAPKGPSTETPDGYIRQGDKAFKAMLENLKKEDFTDITKELHPYGRVIEELAGLRVIETDAVIMAKDDFSFGFYSHAPPVRREIIAILGEKEFNRLFPKPTLVLTEEIRSNPDRSIIIENIYHEINCGTLGHYEAIFVQQAKFPENYRNGNYDEDKDGKKYLVGHKGDPSKPFKGDLGRALRQIIDLEVAASLYEKIHASRKLTESADDLISHVQTGALIANAVAKKLAISEADREKIVTAFLLHDIGKMDNQPLWDLICSNKKISREYVNGERRLIDTHSAHSAKIIKELGLDISDDIIRLVENHHHPETLESGDLRRLGEIIYWADQVDSMMAERSYQGKDWQIKSIPDLLEMMKYDKKSAFDSKICQYEDIYNAVFEFAGTSDFSILYPDTLKKKNKFLAGKFTDAQKKIIDEAAEDVTDILLQHKSPEERAEIARGLVKTIFPMALAVKGAAIRFFLYGITYIILIGISDPDSYVSMVVSNLAAPICVGFFSSRFFSYLFRAWGIAKTHPFLDFIEGLKTDAVYIRGSLSDQEFRQAVMHEFVHLLKFRSHIKNDVIVPVASAMGALSCLNEDGLDFSIEEFDYGMDLMKNKDIPIDDKFKTAEKQAGKLYNPGWYHAEPGYTYKLGVMLLGMAYELSLEAGNDEDLNKFLYLVAQGKTPAEAEIEIRKNAEKPEPPEGPSLETIIPKPPTDKDGFPKGPGAMNAEAFKEGEKPATPEGLSQDTFAKRLGSIRVSKRIKLKELAGMVGTTVSKILQWERGKKVPSDKTIKKLAKALDTNFRKLTGKSAPVMSKIGPRQLPSEIYDNNTFSRRVKSLRVKRGLTQEALASLAGITRVTLALWEKGYCLPQPYNMKNLAEALGTTSEELMRGIVPQESFPDTLGGRIKSYRRKLALTQEDLATLTGINRVLISYFETGKMFPKAWQLKGLAKAFGVKVEELRSGLSPETPSHEKNIPKPKTPPPGSIYSVFKHLCDNDITERSGGITGQAIADSMDRSYATIDYDLRALLYHLKLIQKPEGDRQKTGKAARYYVPEAVKKKVDKILPILTQFMREDLRPDTTLLDQIYENDIKPILEMQSALKGPSPGQLKARLEKKIIRLYREKNPWSFDIIDKSGWDFLLVARRLLQKDTFYISRSEALMVFINTFPPKKLAMLQDCMTAIKTILEFADKAENDPDAEDFVKSMTKLAALEDIDTLKISKYKLPHSDSVKPYLDLASGTNAAIFINNLNPKVQYYFTDKSLYVTEYLENVARLSGLANVKVLRGDILNLDFTAGSLGTVRVKNVLTYVDVPETYWDKIALWLEEGGQLIIQSDPTSGGRSQCREISRILYEKLVIKQGWSFDFKLGIDNPNPDKATLDTVIFTKPPAGTKLPSYRTLGEYDGEYAGEGQTIPEGSNLSLEQARKIITEQWEKFLEFSEKGMGIIIRSKIDIKFKKIETEEKMRYLDKGNICEFTVDLSKISNAEEIKYLWWKTMAKTSNEVWGICYGAWKKRGEDTRAIIDGKDPEGVNDIVARLVPQWEIRNTDRVLDVGTGYGSTAMLLADKAKEIVAIDVIDELLKAAQKITGDKKITNIKFCKADAAELSFSDSSFDKVVMSACLEFMPPELRKIACREAYRVLKEGGSAIILVSPPMNTANRLGLLKEEEWKEELGRIGFEKISITPIRQKVNPNILFYHIHAKKPEPAPKGPSQDTQLPQRLTIEECRKRLIENLKDLILLFPSLRNEYASGLRILKEEGIDAFEKKAYPRIKETTDKINVKAKAIITLPAVFGFSEPEMQGKMDAFLRQIAEEAKVDKVRIWFGLYDGYDFTYTRGFSDQDLTFFQYNRNEISSSFPNTFRAGNEEEQKEGKALLEKCGIVSALEVTPSKPRRRDATYENYITIIIGRSKECAKIYGELTKEDSTALINKLDALIDTKAAPWWGIRPYLKANRYYDFDRFMAILRHGGVREVFGVGAFPLSIDKIKADDNERRKYLDELAENLKWPDKYTISLKQMETFLQILENGTNFKPDNITPYVHDRVKLFRQEAAAKGLEFITELSDEDLVVQRCDLNMMGVLIDNLIQNAIKYTKKGSIKISLTRKMMKEEGGLKEEMGSAVFEVEDTGIGIPKEERRRIFERGYRASNVSNIQGTGIGLDIVATIVEFMHGDVQVESEVGKGTKFTVRLPIYKPSKESEAEKRLLRPFGARNDEEEQATKPVTEAEKLIAQNIPDIENMLQILNDLAAKEKKQDELKYYTIRYNSTKIPQGSLAEKLLKEYVEKVLPMWMPGKDRIKLAASGVEGQSIISVECFEDRARSKEIGEGHIDINEDVSGKALRVIGMLNMAFLASQIPHNVPQGELDRYETIISIIRKQYKEISGEDMPPEVLLDTTKGIWIKLPHAAKVPLDKVDEYYRQTILQLQQSA